jgi:ribosomal protein L37AE/L43A
MAKKRGRRYNGRNYYKKRSGFSRNDRDYLSPHYTKWRKDIKERDNHMCQWPGCLSRKSNGITLCRKCHDSIKGKEADYEGFFLKVLEWQMIDKIKKYDKDK